MFGPLSDNGGPTLTQALWPGSPAIDAGIGNSLGLEFDQRGFGFSRVVGETIDLRPIEVQSGVINVDFNNDGLVDIVDLDALINNIAVGPTEPLVFDLTGDGLVSLEDRDVWLVDAGAINLPNGDPYPLADAQQCARLAGRTRAQGKPLPGLPGPPHSTSGMI